MNRTLGHRAPLLWITLPFLGGLTAGRAGFEAPVAWLLGAALLAGGFAVRAVFCGHRRWAVLLAGAMLLAGNASHTLHQRRVPAREQLPPREAELEVQVERLFASRLPGRFSGLARVTGTPAHLRELQGQRLYLALALPPGRTPPVVSAVLAVIGVLSPLPPDRAAGSFDTFLADAGVNFRLERGRMLAEVRPANAYRRFCAAAADRLEAILDRDTVRRRPELAAAYRAMMLGRQQELDEAQVQAFRLSGTMHIFSISGMHIAAIALGLRVGLAALRLPARGRMPVALVLLWLYVDITGTAPSAVRAFVMVALLEAASALRRPLNPLAALAAASLAVVLADPLQVFSASFRMSYGIVAALVLLGLPLAEAWRERWEPFRTLPATAWRWWHRFIRWAWSGLSQAIAFGLAATLVGTITGLQYFQLLTPGALLVNLALIPLSSGVIWAGLLALICGLAGLNAWSELFNRAALLILWVCDQVIGAALRLPGMWFEARFAPPWLGGAALVVLLALLLAGYARGWPRRLGGFWTPFAFVALVLLLAVDF